MKSKKMQKLLIGLFVSSFFLISVFFFGGNFIKDFFRSEVSGSDLVQELFISGENNYYGRGSLIALTSKDEPVINLGAHYIEGDAEVEIYQVTMEDVLQTLTYDKKGQQLYNSSSLDKYKKLTSFTQHLSSGGERNYQRVSLPLEKTGVWLVRASLSGVDAKVFIVRSDIGALVKEGDNKMIFWTQDLSDKKSLSDVRIKVYNLKEGVKKRYQVQTNYEGIAESSISENDDVAIIEKNGDVALVPINFRNTNGYNYKSFIEKVDKQTFFTFTDRPLYTPGDKIYFKSIIREDDDARYSIKGGNAEVEIFTGWGEEKEVVGKKKYEISAEGTISGEFELAKDLKNGSYTLGIINDKKPVSNDEFDRYDYYPDYLSQASFSVEYYQKPEYSIAVSVEKDDIISGDELSFLVEGKYFSGQPISDQEFAYSVYSSDFYEYAYHREFSDYGFSNNYRYGYRGGKLVTKGTATLDSNGQFKVDIDSTIADDENRKSQIFSIEVELKDDSGNQSYERKNALVRAGEFGIYRDHKNYTYGAKVGEEIVVPLVIEPRSAGKELIGKVDRTWWEKDWSNNQKYPIYNKRDESLASVSATTNSQGEATLRFTANREGSYTMMVEGFDSRKNRITKEFNFWVSDSNGYYSGREDDQGLTIKADKEEYAPTDTAELTIYSETPDRDVFFSMERDRVDRYKIIHIRGHKEVIQWSLIESDMPNMFASVGSFSDLKMESSTETIKVSTESKKIKILLTPDKAKYEPGDRATFKIKTTDYQDNPISVDMAVWSVDKALFELMDSNTGDIFNQFWHERYHSTESSNSLIGISGELAEKGGGGGGGGRDIFKDTAYWNAKVHTDEDGYAEVSFELPDNLTTWVLSGVGSTRDTKVGQVTNEIKVSKDVIMRPVLPNILRVSDEVTISALAQNFTDKDTTFKVKMEFDSGEVENASQEVVLKSKESKTLYWKVHPTKENENSQMKFSLLGSDAKNSDIVTKSLPIRKAGFWETRAEAGAEKSDYEIKFSPDADAEKTQVSLSLSSTMLGQLPNSMKYLIGYPYGCIEQTTSRFVPVVISKENSELFKDSIGEKNLDEYMKIGVERLSTMQGDDGGWGWWGDASEYFVSTYVTEYLLRARAVGASVDDEVLARAKKYFQKDLDFKCTAKECYEIDVMRAYGLSLFGEKRLIENFNDESSPDILALAIISNVRNGFNDPGKNGRDKLISMAKKEGENKIFWEQGDNRKFGSIDASTGLALRAFIMAGGDKDTASKVARFLTEKRQNNYWSNTFATVQAIHGLIDFSKIEKAVFPNYQYTVRLDDREIASGTFDNKNWEDEIVLDARVLEDKTASLNIQKTGDSSLYSELLIKEFRFDDDAEAQNNGINVVRNYTNLKGGNYSIGVGDTVNVELKISGDFASGSYAVIEDQLPAGMVPINPKFDNSQYSLNYRNDISFRGQLKEMTENRVVFATNYYNPKNTVFSYRSRVVSEGEFQVPPVVSSLMYSPEINGRSSTQKIKLVNRSEKLFDYPTKSAGKNTVAKKLSALASQNNSAKILFTIFSIIFIAASSWIIYKRNWKQK